MRHWLKLAMWLYPASWRARYRREFDALLTDIHPRPGDLWDIFCGAIVMHLSTPATYLKLGAVTAVIGALVAGGISFTMPVRYVSTAVLRVMPQIPPGTDAAQYEPVARDRMTVLQQDVLSRNSLAAMIVEPGLDLYPADRTRYPLEDVIQNLRDQDIRIQAVDANLPFKGSATVFEISFEYPDRVKAQRVVRSLVSRFMDANVRSYRGGTSSQTVSTAQAPAPLLVNLEVLDPPNLPERAREPNRLGIAAIGLGAGFALGLLLAFLKRRPLRWTLWIAGSAVVGFVAFFAIAISADLDLVPFASLGAAMAASIAAYILRDRAAWRPVPYVKSALAAAVCGAILTGLASFAAPEHFVSSAVLRIIRRDAAGLAASDSTDAAAERLHRLQFEALSRNSLAELIQRPSLDLYRQERQRMPLEDVILDMRRDIRLLPVDPVRGTFTISFEHTDRKKAQTVVREFVTNLVEGNVMQERNLKRGPGEARFVVEVVDPASDPSAAVSPRRPQWAAVGSGFGLAAGVLIAFLRRRPPGEARAMLRFAAATGAAGAVVAGLISLAISSRYISTATLRLSPPANQETLDPAATQQIQQRLIEVLSRSSLTELILRPSLNLYRSERYRKPLEEIVASMRQDDLKIASLDLDPRTGNTTAFSIAFEYSDPRKAHDVVQEIVDKFIEGGIAQTNLEVVDPPSIPQAPAFPPRLPIAAIGLAAGLVLGPIAVVVRRRQAYSAAA
jgi:uncharacterized protein involved in exopolysaccharide biosynthesis